MGGSQINFSARAIVFLARKTKAVNEALHRIVGVFDAFGNHHLLLAAEQRHLAHLLQIHPHRIVQNVEPAFFLLFLFRLRLLDAVHFRLLHNIDFEMSQPDINLIQFLRRDQF